ncbi:MAG: methionine biosynthesis protein MetW [Desulfobacterales bacterium]
MPSLIFDNDSLRSDLQIIAAWIAPNSRVLDLGCGAGDLLHYLKTRKKVRGTGIEHDEEKVARCIEKGVTVLQGDINAEVLDYPDDAFDTVILSQTLQQVYEPAALLRTILRIGKKAVVSFPNFGHWLVRLQLLLTGYAPVTRQLPYQWYDTPNIRVISLKDFRKFARTVGFRIFEETAIRVDGRGGQTIGCLPNLRASFGIFLIGR